ncbi:MAG TPA: hypothetical protein VFB15_11485 [Candidatus Binataceae bacterium]|jgi:hypothetical protein|nr:hypothetical protein [Candidatus Binataceae bacterium]
MRYYHFSRFALLAGVCLAGCAVSTPHTLPIIHHGWYGTHETSGGENLPQNITSHANVSCPSGGAATQILGTNTYRVDAKCIDTGSNSVNIGDATVSQSGNIGEPFQPNGPGDDIEVTGPLYCSSTSGTTVNCTEIVRP